MANEKDIIIENVKDALKELLQRRTCELGDTVAAELALVDEDDDAVWKKGFEAGYTTLLEDLNNLLDCDWLTEVVE